MLLLDAHAIFSTPSRPFLKVHLDSQYISILRVPLSIVYDGGLENMAEFEGVLVKHGVRCISMAASVIQYCILSFLDPNLRVSEVSSCYPLIAAHKANLHL